MMIDSDAFLKSMSLTKHKTYFKRWENHGKTICMVNVVVCYVLHELKAPTPGNACVPETR